MSKMQPGYYFEGYQYFRWCGQREAVQTRSN